MENEIDSESEKTRLLENALDAVVGIDEKSRIIFWNKNAETIFGWTKSEMLQKELIVIIPERYRAAHLEGIKRFSNTGIAKIQNQRIEIPGLRKNGEEFVMELTVSSMRTQYGLRFYSFMRDISDQKQNQFDLQQREKEFTQLANSIPQLMWMAESP